MRWSEQPKPRGRVFVLFGRHGRGLGLLFSLGSLCGTGAIEVCQTAKHVDGNIASGQREETGYAPSAVRNMTQRAQPMSGRLPNSTC